MAEVETKPPVGGLRGFAHAPADGGLARVKRRAPKDEPAPAARERVTVTVA